ncbi:MAG: phosphoenolpyruvate--protein phosphotransferase [Proteobacteria bacterium]|nr:phosphoenolpyruvate--protein phosphotransferase [Pseudomonadota bacterium]
MDIEAERSVLVRVPEGLHARPVAQLVALAKAFPATLEIVHGSKSANPRSAVKLLLLSIKEHDRVIVRGSGADAHEAVDAVCRLLEDTTEAAIPGGISSPFAERAPEPATEPDDGQFRGIGGSEGVALGPAFPYFRQRLVIDRTTVPAAQRAEQVAAFRSSLDLVCAQTDSADATASQIQNALSEIVRDVEWTGGIEAAIAAGLPAVAATLDAGETLAMQFEAVPDPYVRARADDVRGAARAIALNLTGVHDPALGEAPDGAIIIAEDLNAWDVADADLSQIGGIVCRTGTPAAHIAIMARAYGIPAVFGCGMMPEVAAGVEIGIDGAGGMVFVAPGDAERARLMSARTAWTAKQDNLQRWASVRPVTRSGHAVQIAANLGSIKEIDAARRAGAMGVGLFRSELLFSEHRRPLTEQEQFETYDAVARAFGDHPVIIRTLDIGGDKSVPGIDIPPEGNPFLGWRGIRLCLDRPDLFKPQLRALLRAAVNRNLKIMLPMISEASEIHRTRALIDECRRELAAEAIAHDRPATGIMIETPASVLLAEELAKEVDFFSIGTNDLTQYIMAADRLNPCVAALSRPENPAVFKAIAMTCAAAMARGIPISVCGEAASSPPIIAKLLSFGIRSLSMSPSSILRIKQFVSEEAGL